MNNKNYSQYNKLKKYEAKGLSMTDSHSIVLEKAKGSKLWDVDGNSYIDMCSGFGSLPLGHSYPQEVLRSSENKETKEQSWQLIQGMGDVYSSKDKIALLELVCSVLPFSSAKGGLCVGGAQAVELAVKSAHLFTKNTGVISFSNAYHGLDLGVLAFASRKDFRSPFINLYRQDIVKRLPFACGEEVIVAALEEQRSKGIGTCAILLEPIQGRGGGYKPPKAWLKRLKQLATAYGALVVYDEIFTGFGRCGRLFCLEDASDCDIICLGKAMAGGMPLAGCFAKAEIMDAWKECSEPIYTGTYFGHPLSCFVGYKTIKTIIDSRLDERSLKLGIKIQDFLYKRLNTFPIIKDLRVHGLFIVIDFCIDGFGVQLMQELRRNLVIAIPSGVNGGALSLTPALNIPEDLLWEALDCVVCCIKKISY